MSPLARLDVRFATNIPWAYAHGFTISSLARLDGASRTVTIGRSNAMNNCVNPELGGR